jgi:prepilin-type N-terminal cleavage/methylation domain-containing protein/prepilin-type processing-associated H-X9-DG protein
MTRAVFSVKINEHTEAYPTGGVAMSRSARKGFKLIELLVVIAIIGVVIGLLLPAVRRVREPANRASCANNLHQLVLAIHNYQSTYKMCPPGCIGYGAVPEERLGWMVALLPYLEQDSLYQQIDFQNGYGGNLPAVQTRIRTFLCPSANAESMADAVTHYVAMSGIGLDAATRPAGSPGNGFMGYDRLTSLSMIKDGTSNTIALMETRSGLGPWARGGPSNIRGFDPTDVPFFGDHRPFGGHPNGMNAAMADGSVRFIPSSIDPSKLAGAITIDGGEPFDLD